jgi:hypothetical protein
MKNRVENFIYYKYLVKVALKFLATFLVDSKEGSLKPTGKTFIAAKLYNQNVYFDYTMESINIFSHHYWVYTGNAEYFPLGFLYKIPQNEMFQENPLQFLLGKLYWWSNYRRNSLVSFCDFFEHYPKVNLMFDEVEFPYIDLWLEIPKFLEELLFELSERGSPFIGIYKEIKTEPNVLNWYETIAMLPPLEKNVNFEKHFEEYFFGKGSHLQLPNMLSCYLENRPEVKKLCEESWKKDKLVNESLTNNLNIYFLCNYSLKGLSNYTLRFLASNCELDIKNPLKPFREASEKSWKLCSPEERKRYKERILITKFNEWKAKVDWD